MTYDENRDYEQMRAFDADIDAFINRWAVPPSNPAHPRQLVFFLPGGMASQLMRADTAFVEGAGYPLEFTYSLVWINWLTTFTGGARDLQMHRDATNTFRDKGDRFIIAQGLVGEAEIPEFEQWCTANSCYPFTFYWDWRRRLDEVVRFFIDVFLPEFRHRVTTAPGNLPDPLANFSLVGHSFGGMLANLILRANDPLLASLSKSITVATPFYGYAGQTHRWFVGEPLLNGLGAYTRDITRTIGSLPSLYPLMFMEASTYDDGTNNPLFRTGPHALAGYPSMDKSDATSRADAYNPGTNGMKVRYPANYGFDYTELDYGRLQAQQIAAPMAPALLQKFYNIRGVRAVSDTGAAVTWNWIDPGFDPLWDGLNPPISDVMGPGDDTQPAWTACLVTNAAARCIDVLDPQVTHVTMMNNASVIQELARILCPPGGALAQNALPSSAKKESVRRFLQWLMRHRRRKEWPPFRRDAPPPQALPEDLKKQWPGIVHSLYGDLVRGPVGRHRIEPARPPRRPKKPGKHRPRRRKS
jgi:hypothetical protein